MIQYRSVQIKKKHDHVDYKKRKAKPAEKTREFGHQEGKGLTQNNERKKTH